jgi:hypothetical protein
VTASLFCGKVVTERAFVGPLGGVGALRQVVLVYLVKDLLKDVFLAFDSISFMIAVGVGLITYLVLVRR